MGRTSINIISALVVQNILVVSEILSVVAIYLARAMNDFQTGGPAITLSSAQDYSKASRTGNAKKLTNIKMRSLRGDTDGVRNKITHDERADAESESSQKGIIRSVGYEVTVDLQSEPAADHEPGSSGDSSMQIQQGATSHRGADRASDVYRQSRYLESSA